MPLWGGITILEKIVLGKRVLESRGKVKVVSICAWFRGACVVTALFINMCACSLEIITL